jgi:Glycosyl hydrolase catalytic core
MRLLGLLPMIMGTSCFFVTTAHLTHRSVQFVGADEWPACEAIGESLTSTEYVIVDLAEGYYFYDDDDGGFAAQAFAVAYDNSLAECWSRQAGAFREIRSVVPLNIGGPIGSSFVLRVEIDCNDGCGGRDQIDLWSQDEPVYTDGCTCPGPYKPAFLSQFNEVYKGITNAAEVLDVRQVTCGEADNNDGGAWTNGAFNFAGKKGVGFQTGPQATTDRFIGNQVKVAAMNVFWWYSWSTLPANECSFLVRGVEFVPMVWGGKNSSRFDINLANIESLDARYVFGFNEPDGEEQANMAVEEAVNLWPRLMALGKPLLSPACVEPLGEWMYDFMTYVDEFGLRVDAVGVHYYHSDSPDVFKERMEMVYEQFGLPLVITEMGVADWDAESLEEHAYTPDQVLAFMQDVLPWMEEQDWILGYAWFNFAHDHPQGYSSALLDETNSLTELGRFYADFNANSNIRL